MNYNEINYDLLCRQLGGFIETDPAFMPVLANASALLMETLPDINWAGFYLMRGEDGFCAREDLAKARTGEGTKPSGAGEPLLVLGPFQGKPACIHIAVGRGVCGTAVSENRTQRVENVHEFPGHIACDSASNSEIVVPIHDRENPGRVLGVLDIDSPEYARFDEADERGLEEFVRVLEEGVVWS